MRHYLKIATLLYFCLFLISPTPSFAKTNDSPINLDLKDVEIFSASREKEPTFKTASSAYVLSSDDIRRSGATNIPEVLRLVPGLEVYRSSSSKWSVTSRGFGRLYDNKVLVMIDGREIYSSVFTGTNWDISDLVLDDIDRIEVIRGGSTTTWGANSLNGVIHIITKKAQYTQGGHVSVLYGNKEKSTEFRYGSKIKNDIFYRAWAKKIHREDTKSVDSLRGKQFEDAGDEWGMSKAGFRLDWQKTVRDEITVQGDAHDGKEDQVLFIPTRENRPVYDSENVNGFNLDTRWKHAINKTDHTNLHFYVDSTSRKSQLYSIDRNIFNIDGEYHLQPIENNKLKVGFGYRYTIDSMKDGYVGNILVNDFTPEKENTKLYNAFFQDTHSIIPNKLDFTFGGKFEKHYLTGDHFMPSAQLKWTPNDQNTLWTSYSEGVREPSKLETNLRRLVSNVGPYKIYWQGNRDFKDERIKSYEIGWRNRSFDRLELDLSAFYNEYENVRTFEPNLAKLQYELYNRGRARADGINASANLSVLDNWNLTFGYSYLDMDILFDKDSADTLSSYDAGVSPHHQIQVQSRWNVTRDIDFDSTFYYVGNLHTVSIESNKRLDLRLAWRPVKNIELSIVGQKLFYGDTRETTRAFYGTHNATYGNQVYGNIKWNFD
jgi:iron complex outermembrane receptor protein